MKFIRLLNSALKGGVGESFAAARRVVVEKTRPTAEPAIKYILDLYGIPLTKFAIYNGVLVRTDVVHRREVIEDYEEALFEALRANITEGDSVTIVGGGHGGSTVVAAQCTGPDGCVSVFEASKQHTSMVEEAARHNDTPDCWTVEHAIIAEPGRLYGDSEGAKTIPPADLPECDVLSMDCDGAELAILDGLEIRPPTIIVETHAVFDSPEWKVRRSLKELGYEVVDRGVEHEEQGVFILTAKLTD